MKLNYYILWIEDDESWYNTASQLFKEVVDDYGFFPIVERKQSFDEVSIELKNNGLKKYDIFLIDFKLRNSKNGDGVIDLIRENHVFTDILFYSSDKQSITDAIREHLFEGVYHSDRKELEDKFEKVFRTTIKKIEEVNSMRGLIVGETSELDALIDELIYSSIGIKKFYEKIKIDDFVSKEIITNSKNRIDKLESDFNQNGIFEIIPKMEAIKKWEFLREILKKNRNEHDYIVDFLKINSTYQHQVIEIRNKFAHSKVIHNAEGKEVLKAQIGNQHFEFDENKFLEIRNWLKEHKQSLENLREILFVIQK